MQNIHSTIIRTISFIVFLLFTTTAVVGQNGQKEKMASLSFLVGDWVGISATYEKGIKTKEIPAFEKISYQLDGHIITIDLKSEALQLHTVIYYDDEAKTYYYNPYYKTGTARYPAELIDQQLVVHASETKRFIFRLTAEGNFQEYGERLENGRWTKYFEDTFKRI